MLRPILEQPLTLLELQFPINVYTDICCQRYTQAGSLPFPILRYSRHYHAILLWSSHFQSPFARTTIELTLVPPQLAIAADMIHVISPILFYIVSLFLVIFRLLADPSLLYLCSGPIPAERLNYCASVGGLTHHPPISNFK